MSWIETHIEHSMKNIRERYPEIYEERRKILEELIRELHVWFDYFAGKKEKDYDYTGINFIKHREKRHHIEGIKVAVEIFTRKYGKEFTDIVEEEGRRHVIEDMAYVYSELDYIWREIRGS